MNIREFLLSYLGSEGAEIAHTTAKSLHFGLDDQHPDKPDPSQNNQTDLIGELNDLLGVAAMLVAHGILPMNWQNMEAQARKCRKVERMARYSITRGTLQHTGPIWPMVQGEGRTEDVAVAGRAPSMFDIGWQDGVKGVVPLRELTHDDAAQYAQGYRAGQAFEKCKDRPDSVCSTTTGAFIPAPANVRDWRNVGLAAATMEWPNDPDADGVPNQTGPREAYAEGYAAGMQARGKAPEPEPFTPHPPATQHPSPEEIERAAIERRKDGERGTEF